MSEHQGMTFPATPFAEWPRHITRTDGASITAAGPAEADEFLKGDDAAIKAHKDAVTSTAEMQKIQAKRHEAIAKANAEADAALAKLTAARDEKAAAEAAKPAPSPTPTPTPTARPTSDPEAMQRENDAMRRAAERTSASPQPTPHPQGQPQPPSPGAQPVGGPHDSASLQQQSMQTMGATQTAEQDGRQPGVPQAPAFPPQATTPPDAVRAASTPTAPPPAA